MHRRSILDSHSGIADSQRRIRRAQDDILPRSEAKLSRSEESLSQSVGRELESTQRILDPDPFDVEVLSVRDCADCRKTGAMKLQNVARTHLTRVPLLYICSECGAMLTIPPRVSPVPNE